MDFRGSSDGSGSESRRQEDIVASIMEKVKEIKAELGGTERKLAEGLGHSREIGRLLGLVELVGWDSLSGWSWVIAILNSGSRRERRAAEGDG